MTTTSPPPTIPDVQRIAALDDPVLRNLQITQCYHDLSQAMTGLTGPGANWCTVATWASNQAGRSIRQEDLRRTFEHLLRRSEDATRVAQAAAAQAVAISGDETRSLAGAVDALRDALSPASAFGRTADAVARGNRKVFEEIGLQFARFLALFADGRPDGDALTGFYAGLQPGDPPDGQRYLRQAFSRYVDALSTPDDKQRAELLLLANLEIGFHEQTRLQPEIRAAMDAPIYDPELLRSRLMDELFPDRTSHLRLGLAVMFGRAAGLFAARDRLADEAQRIGRLTVTELMMTLELPGGRVLRLGKPLPDGFPPALQAIKNADLAALLAQVAPTAGAVVEDWSRLPERMRFIAGLFRAYHLDAALFDAPFTAEQLTLISRGQRPEDL